MKKISIHIALIFIAVLNICLNCYADVSLQNLKCEMLENPLGIGTIHPRLSWQIMSNARNTNQTGYRVIVASTAAKLTANQGDLWDSRKIKSDQSILITYAGKS